MTGKNEFGRQDGCSDNSESSIKDLYDTVADAKG